MKRSEMKNFIMKSLYNLGYEIEFDEAGSVLYDIETQGMLPPHVELTDCAELCKPEELFDFANLDGEFVWEQE